MKKLCLVILIILSWQHIDACDLCGCNSGNYFIGPFPQFNRHFISTRYSFQKYNTILHSDQSQFSHDFFQTTELMAGTRIQNNWQLLLFVPYNFYRTSSDDGVRHNNGLGDMTIMANFDLLDKINLNKHTETVFQQLWIGGGIKLPTGKFALDSSEIVSSANQQPGSGSYDFLINTIYSYQIKSWGFNFNANYKINQSAEDFKFGDRLSISTFVFRSIPIAKSTISPNMGLLFESLKANRYISEKVQDTGGQVLMSAVGFELRFNNMTFGANVQLPLSSDLSNGQTDAKMRGMCHLAFLF